MGLVVAGRGDEGSSTMNVPRSSAYSLQLPPSTFKDVRLCWPAHRRRRRCQPTHPSDHCRHYPSCRRSGRRIYIWVGMEKLLQIEVTLLHRSLHQGSERPRRSKYCRRSRHWSIDTNILLLEVHAFLGRLSKNTLSSRIAGLCNLSVRNNNLVTLTRAASVTLSCLSHSAQRPVPWAPDADNVSFLPASFL